MVRRISLLFMFVCLCTSSGWSKMKQEEKDYLDSQIAKVVAQISALQNQMVAYQTKMDALSKELSGLQKAQVDFQDTLNHQHESLTEMELSINSMRQQHSMDFGTVDSDIKVLEGQVHQLTLAANTPPVPATAGTMASAPPPAAGSSSSTVPAAPLAQGNITVVEGDAITVDVGSAQGLQKGSRLSVFKASDPGTRVGELEITDVVDSTTAHARVVNMNLGLHPEAADVVRVE
ncbi:MAG: hypothetical protein ACRD2O_06280 [Terriglobia bacterium]